ncbi:MAG TPA: hypothetical protein PKI59_07325 [Candidatus Cloacimonadota bacterium]|nr:hypothetical protein [Candidatus Cloacimonadota bacterium]
MKRSLLCLLLLIALIILIGAKGLYGLDYNLTSEAAENNLIEWDFCQWSSKDGVQVYIPVDNELVLNITLYFTASTAILDGWQI